ncbi:MAG: hypothetical protein WDL87_08600 [Candidatus Omnitrophota bacterium]|jgi:hypothetical protein
MKKIFNFFFIAFIVSYSVFFIFDNLMLKFLTQEDGVFESFGALCFLASSVLLLNKYLRSKKLFFLLFCIACFFAFGEEISWGQRVVMPPL